MTDSNHPITPSLELLKHWEEQHFDEGENYDVMLIQAYQAGADQELEACCSQLAYWGVHGYNKLYEARRPKPPSLKEQALQALAELVAECYGNTDQSDTIRRALEQLDD